MRIHQLSGAEAIASLNSTPQGLSSVEALRRLGEYGFNRVEEVARESMLLRFLKEFTHLFALILWLAAGLAFLAEWSDPGQGMAKIGYAILAAIVVSGLFSFWQEFRVERTLAALCELLPQGNTFYNFTTTASFSGNLSVCIDYVPSNYSNPTLLQLFHYQAGAWVDVTTTNDTTNGVICGQVPVSRRSRSTRSSSHSPRTIARKGNGSYGKILRSRIRAGASSL
jgi:hypothetical protein